MQELQNQFNEHELRSEIFKLEQVLYAKEKISDWSGNSLLDLIIKLRASLPENIKEASLIVELNPTTQSLD